MMVRLMGFGVVLASAVACDGGALEAGTITDSDYIADAVGPTILHTPITGAQVFGEDVLIEATARDESDVFTVEVMYQQETAVEWKSGTMLEVGQLPDDGGTLFQGRIKGADVGSGGMRYYIHAIDYSDNANEGCLPEDCSEDAWRFAVVPE